MMSPMGKELSYMLVIFFLFRALIANAEVHYIATNGKDSNPGTEEAPWASISKAASAAQPGDTVLIKPGNYSPISGQVSWFQDGSEQNPLVIRAYDINNIPVIDAYHVILRPSNHIYFEYLELINSTIYSNIINIAGGNNIRLRHCKIHGVRDNTSFHSLVWLQTGNPPERGFGKNCLIEYCEFWDADGTALDIKADSCIIRYSTIRDLSNHPTHPSIGILVKASGNGQTDVETRGVKIYNNIFSNVISAIYLGGDSPSRYTEVYNNLIYDSDEAVVVANGYESSFYNNTVHNCSRSAIRYLYGGNRRIYFKNNIFSDCSDAIKVDDTPDIGMVTDYNLWSNVVNPPAEQNGVYGSPSFVDPIIRNFELEPTSAAINRATNIIRNDLSPQILAPQNDFKDNMHRSGQPYDIGAYEYGSVPDSNPPATPKNLRVFMSN